MNTFKARDLILALSIPISVTASLAVIDPCTQATSKHDFVTVNSQYQPVSTCIPQTGGKDAYSYSTYAYVSTTVPCKPDGVSVTNVLVTDTAQWLPVTKYPEVTGTGSNPEVISKQGLARYDEMGDLAISGWAGSGLCKECEVVDANGCRQQKILIQECRTQKDSRTCVEWDEYWKWCTAPQAADIVHPVCAARTYLPAAGTYTLTFPQPAVTKIVTLAQPGNIVTAVQPPWNEYVTTACGGPTYWDFTSTVTKTVTLCYPSNTDRPGATITVTNPPPTGFPPLNGPGNGGPGNGNPGQDDPVDGGPGNGSPGNGSPGNGDPTTGAPGNGSPGNGGPGNGNPNGPGSPSGTVGDNPTYISTGNNGPPTGSPTVSSPFNTISITSVGTNIGTVPVTVTIADPSGTTPGTVVVVVPTTGSGTNGSGGPGGPGNTNSPAPTGSFVTETAGSSGAAIGSPILTVTIANPSGTNPGTVVIVDGQTSSSLGNTVGAILTSTSASASGTPSFTASTTCVGLVCVVVSASLPVGDVDVSATLIPTGTGGASGGTGASASPCTGLLCASIGVSVPGTGATITAGVGNGNNGASTTSGSGGAGATPCTGPLCVSVGLSVSDVVGATLTAGVGNGAEGTTTCTGLLCASVGVSAPVVGATITAGVGNGAEGTTTCTGLLCASVGVSAPVVSATITAGVGNGGDVVAISAPIVGGVTISGTIINDGNGAGGTTTCTGLLCASVGVSAPVVSATITAGVGNGGDVVAISAPIVGGVTVSGTIINGGNGASNSQAGAAGASTCTGLLCASVGVSAPVVSATITAGVGNGGDVVAISAPIVGGVTVSGTIINGGNGAGGTTTCTGLLCASVGVSAPVATATITAGVGNGGDVVAVTAPIVGGVTVSGRILAASSNGASSTEAAAANASPCTGLLCVSAGVSAPIVGATATAGVLNGGSVLAVSVNAAVGTTTRAAVTTTAARTTMAVVTTTKKAATTPCAGALCVGVSVSLKKRSEATPLAANNMIKFPRGHRFEKAKPERRVLQACSGTVNICDGMDLNSLFAVQACSSQVRLGCLSANVLNSASARCLSSGCSTYGVTGDGLLGLTSSLSIAGIQAKVDAFVQANDGVCDVVRSVRLFSNTPGCVA